MLKLSKLVGTAAVLAVMVPVAVFAQTTGKVAPVKAIAVPSAVTAVDSGAPVPTLYDQGTGNQLPGSAQFGQRQGFSGRGLMGSQFTSRNGGRVGMMNRSSNSRSGGSMALRALCALVGGITLALAWIVMILLIAVLHKKLKWMGSCKMDKMEKKPEDLKTK